ncbi:hypothetical protein BC831DRAFT_451923 [Entophlyctis helioformis]|nr:hypothetical protein BC831DRAFT_451923 [Entophlyctis helioformis]
MTAPASNFFLPSIAAAAKPYPYPERQEISHLDEEFIANVLSTQPPPSSHNHDMRGYSRQSPTADHNASAPGQGQQPGQQSGQPGSGTADISAFDLTAQSESAYKTLPPTRSGPTSLALLETGGLRAFVVNSMATSTPLSHELDELDLKLQICELTQREKLFIQDLEKLLKRENVKDERTRKLRKKHVARVFRRLHERVVQLVEAQSDVTGLSKIRREQMERFLEASKKNLIFLEVRCLFGFWLTGWLIDWLID